MASPGVLSEAGTTELRTDLDSHRLARAAETARARRRDAPCKSLPLRQSVSSKRPFLRQSEKGPHFPAVSRYYSPEHVRYRTAVCLKLWSRTDRLTIQAFVSRATSSWSESQRLAQAECRAAVSILISKKIRGLTRGSPCNDHADYSSLLPRSCDGARWARSEPPEPDQLCMKIYIERCRAVLGRPVLDKSTSYSGATGDERKIGYSSCVYFVSDRDFARGLVDCVFKMVVDYVNKHGIKGQTARAVTGFCLHAGRGALVGWMQLAAGGIRN